MSHSTTLAPANKTAFELAMNVVLGTITSSPGPIFKLLRHANIPSVQLLIEIEYLAFVIFLIFSSNFFVSLSSVTNVDLTTDFR